jgi:hypothetical protein
VVRRVRGCVRSRRWKVSRIEEACGLLSRARASTRSRRPSRAIPFGEIPIAIAAKEATETSRAQSHRPRGRTNTPHAIAIDSPGGSRVVKRASPRPRSASAGPEPSGARPLDEIERRSRESGPRRTSRRVSTKRKLRNEGNHAVKIAIGFRAGSTRGTRFSKLDWFGVQTTIEAHLDRDARQREQRSRKRAT